MKRCWIGGGFLIVLLVVGLLTTFGMDKCHSAISQDIRQAGEAAVSGDWEAALPLASQAEAQWQKCWHFSAALADHEPMEEIDGLFAQLDAYAQAKDGAAYAAACAQLAKQTQAMADAHALNWWNVL